MEQKLPFEVEDELDFRALFEGAPGLYLVIKPDAPRFTILSANRAYLEATKTERENILGRPLFEVFPDNPHDPGAAGVDSLRHSLAKVIETGKSHTLGVIKYDIPIRDANEGGFEERYWTPINSPVHDSEGKVRYIIHRVEDVTSFVLLKEQRSELASKAERMEVEIYSRSNEVQKANQELARLNQKLQHLDDLKSQFFANVSHELRTPITLIIGPVDQALAEGGHTDEVEHLLRNVRQNARLLLKHVNDLLEITKIEAGKVEPHYVQVDLADLTQQLAGNFESLAHSRNIHYSVLTPPHLTAQVDPGKVQKIVLNLLANALKFTPSGGTVTLSLGVDGAYAELRVGDSGPGIPEALRSRVFERFYQSENPSTRRYGGTGLGLSIVREFVHLHRGEVKVEESSLGGAEFLVRLPLQADAGTVVDIVSTGFPEESVELSDWQLSSPSPTTEAFGQAPPPPLERAEERPTVLVVEDNPQMLDYICRNLAEFTTIRARDGREGLEQARNLAPDLILTDVMMPGMSGPQMLSEIRSYPELDGVPVVVLTARAEDDLRVELLKAGAQDYLFKPFGAEELATRVSNLIKAKRTQEKLAAAYGDLKATQAQLVHAAKMASLGQLVAGLAHEINNPIAYATNHLYMVTNWMKEIADSLTEDLSEDILAKWQRVEKRLSSAREGVDRVKELVVKLRTFSRLDQGEFKAVDIVESVESVLMFLEHRMSGRIEVQRYYGPQKSVECFPGALNQVIMNLVSNAIEAIEGPGTITISTGQKEDCFYLSVQDTGCGLPTGQEDKIFDPFFTTKPVGIGTGLGLSISYGIMESHRGRIRALNRAEGGSEFILEIPLDLANLRKESLPFESPQS